MSADQQPMPGSDEWSRWLLQVRSGGDPDFDRYLRGEVLAYADRVIDQAGLQPGMALADIGTGDGLVALRAIERLGPSLRVIMADISAPLLQQARAQALKRGVLDQCSFVECAADRLAGIGDQNVDVVATRAVLAYVADKQAALREFFRVLKPGGRISLVEPIFQDDAFAARALRDALLAKGAGTTDSVLPLLHRWKAAQFPDTQEKIDASPIANFSERNLFNLILAAGFMQVHLELHMDLVSSRIPTWQAFVESSPHPWAPPLSRIMAESFTPEERRTLENFVRPLVESGKGVVIVRNVYAVAVKPPA